MINKLEEAIKVLIEKSSNICVTHDDALKFTQAVLNLAHARNVIKSTDFSHKGILDK